VNELDQLPAEDLRKIVAFQSEQNRRYRKLFLGLSAQEITPQEAFGEAPSLGVVDMDGMDTGKLWAAYQEHEAKFDTAPFDPAGEKFRLYPGGVTIWSGFPGTGKTTLLRQLVCQLLQRDRGVFVASLEEPPDHMLVRLMMTACGTATPTEDQLEWFVHAFGERLRMWGVVGVAPFKTILAAARYAIRRERCSHVVIDSLTCLDIGGSDWDGQRGLANDLCELARSTKAHVHLVAHPRKPMKAEQAVDISDIAGSSDLGRLADNVVFVRRNLDGEPTDFHAPTEMQIVVRKQRHGTGMCGQIKGWFNRTHRQFHREQYDPATRYLPEDAYRG
jgi:twinkle protein